MITHEADAKTKICMVGGSDPEGVFPRCRASNCMHWMIVNQPTETFMISSEQLMADVAKPPGDGWFLSSENGRPCWRRNLPALGTCGLSHHAG